MRIERSSAALTFAHTGDSAGGAMAAKRLVPLLDRVLVEKLAPPTKTTGGVLLPETASKVRRCVPAC